MAPDSNSCTVTAFFCCEDSDHPSAFILVEWMLSPVTVGTHLCLLPQQLILHSSFFLYRHSFLVFFEILSFPGLKVEPSVGEGTNLGQQSLDEWMELILRGEQTNTLNTEGDTTQKLNNFLTIL